MMEAERFDDVFPPRRSPTTRDQEKAHAAPPTLQSQDDAQPANESSMPESTGTADEAPDAAALDSLDEHLLSILQRPINGPAAPGFFQKEKEIAGVLRMLDEAKSRALHARLAPEPPNPDDVVAREFGRLMRDRRERLLAVLTDHRRLFSLASRRA